MMDRRRKAAHVEAAGRLHRTADVPQADRLENVRQLVMAVRDGIAHTSTLLELLDVDRRHFDYYRTAAVILGMVESRGDGVLELTERGRQLAATPEGSALERAILKDAILGARALRPFSSFFRGDEVELEVVAERLHMLTGLSDSTAMRRARTLFQWRKYVQVEEATSELGLEVPDLTAQLDGLVARHNALVKQRVLEWLGNIEPARFERIVAQLLEAMGYASVKVRGRSGDGGVDVEAVLEDRWGHAAPVAIQVKRYAKPVSRRFVDELIGVIARQRYVSGILVTTADFSTAATTAAKDEPRLRLVSGAKFVGLLAEHGVLVKAGRHGELVVGERIKV